MINISQQDYHVRITNTGENGEVLAKGDILIWNKEHFLQFIENLILEEIICIREYDLDEELTDFEILEEFKDNFNDLYMLKASVKDEDKIVFIDSIENCSNVKFAARDMVDYLKEKYDKILLYPIEDAIGYWRDLGFRPYHAERFYGYNF